MNEENTMELKVKLEDEEKWINLPFVDCELPNGLQILEYKGLLLIDDIIVVQSNISQLNQLAIIIKQMDKKEIDKMNVILASGEYANNIIDVMNIADNIDLFEVIDNVNSYFELGKYYGGDEINIDYSELGKIIAGNENGIFINNCYLSCSDSSYYQRYNG